MFHGKRCVHPVPKSGDYPFTHLSKKRGPLNLINLFLELQKLRSKLTEEVKCSGTFISTVRKKYDKIVISNTSFTRELSGLMRATEPHIYINDQEIIKLELKTPKVQVLLEILGMH